MMFLKKTANSPKIMGQCVEDILYKYILLVRVICEKYRLRGEENIPSRFMFV
jgi:hypothetical protein